jgi:hypothetical protein
MSKEFGHILFAIKVLEILPDKKLSRLLNQHKKLYLWGSILPDSTYYFKDIIPVPEPFKLSETIHGDHGENLYTFISCLGNNERKPGEDNELLWPVIAGIITHYALDTAIHPIIRKWEMTSDEPDTLHRLIESWLDKKIFDNFGIVPDYKFLKNLSHMPDNFVLNNVTACISNLFKKKKGNLSIKQYLYISSILQKSCLYIFSSPLLKFMVASQNKNKKDLSKYQALFIPSKQNKLPAHIENIDWTHLKTTWINEIEHAAEKIEKSWEIFYH